MIAALRTLSEHVPEMEGTGPRERAAGLHAELERRRLVALQALAGHDDAWNASAGTGSPIDVVDEILRPLLGSMAATSAALSVFQALRKAGLLNYREDTDISDLPD